MAGGAPSQKSDAIAAAARAAQTIELDPTQVPPMVTEQFGTGQVNTVQLDEERDEQDKITQPALVELHMTEPPMFAQLGDQIIGRGGTRRVTRLSPDLAIALGESMAEDGRLALASMKEQPLQPGNGLVVAGPGDVPAVAAAAEQAAGMKGDPA